jgi:hypothetical protein
MVDQYKQSDIDAAELIQQTFVLTYGTSETPRLVELFGQVMNSWRLSLLQNHLSPHNALMKPRVKVLLDPWRLILKTNPRRAIQESHQTQKSVLKKLLREHDLMLA